MADLSIGQFSTKADINASTLRYYESIGLLPAPEGFESQGALSDRWEQMAKQKRSELEARKNQLNMMIQILDSGLSCRCLTWSECLEKMNPD